MRTEVELTLDEPRQLAFLASAAVVRAFVPASMVGVYMLLRDAKPMYVGRSDHCVQTRLCGHALLGQASHISWQPCSGPLHAYRLESAWFHALSPSPTLLNRIHPARPTGWVNECPFCGTRDCLALAHSLRTLGRKCAAQQVVIDQLAVAAKTIGA